MRILYIQQHFRVPTEPGAGRGWEMARRLVASGHRVDVLRGGSSAGVETHDGVRVITIKAAYSNKLTFSERVRVFLSFALRASVAASVRKYDVVFASSTPLTVALPAIVASLLRRTPLVFEVRDLWPEVPVRLGLLRSRPLIVAASLLELVTYGFSQRVIALSPDMERGVLQVLPTAKVEVIPNGCDNEQFEAAITRRAQNRERLGWLDDEVVIVYAGGFGFLYQLSWVVELAAASDPNSIKFALIGEGTDSVDLRKLAEELHLEPDALFLGRLSRAEVIECLVAGDIVLSSLRPEKSLEGSSLNKVFDGFAAGKPILVNHGGWLAEEVRQAGAGWVLPRNIDRAAELLSEIARDNDALRNSGSESATVGRNKFSRDSQFVNFESVLADAAVNLDRSSRVALVLRWLPQTLRRAAKMAPDGSNGVG